MPVSAVEARLDALLLSVRLASVAIACSGGSDSIALALLTHAWAKKHGVDTIAVTVDHGLRAESAQEVRLVAKWLKKHGIAHTILAWEGGKPKSNVQEAARKARYRLMGDYCQKHGIEALLVAHTLDDQAETFLLRLRRGSGVDGLAAMAEITDMEGIRIVRPLLGIRKAQLVEYLKQNKQPYICDPSNENTDYDRVKIRKLIPALIETGLTPERIALAARNMARARKYLHKETDDFLEKHCDFNDKGYVTLSSLPVDEEIALRVLAELLMRIGGQDIPPRLDALEQLYANLRNPSFKGATVGGCKLQGTRKNRTIFIFREQSAVEKPVIIKPGETLLWDNRFKVTLHHSARPLELGALTQTGWLEMAKQYKLKNTCPDKKILYTLPALRTKVGKVVAVPHLGVGEATIPCKVKFVSGRKITRSGAQSSSAR